MPRGRAGGIERSPSDQNDEVAVSGQNRVGRHKLERLSHGLRHQQPVEGVVVVLVQSAQRWLSKSAHSDKWKLCQHQTGVMPEKEAG